MEDTISRKAAIELVKDVCDAIMSGCESRYDPEIEDEVYTDIREVDAILKCNKEVRIALRSMPPAQSESDKEKISELLMRLYLMGLVHLTKDSIVRRQHYCEELWKALFHDDEFPVWMHWSCYRKKGKSMDDTISRKAAIDAMTTTLWHYPNECYRNLNEYEFAKGLAELGLKSVPSAQPEDCDTCKHGYFGDSHCDNCRVRYPSHYERRTE